MYVNFKIKVSHLIIGIVLLGSLLWGGVALAGDPDSTDDPASTTSFSLEDLYQRLAAGTAGSQSAFTEPSVGPGTGTMHTINEIMAVAPALDNTNGATTTQVMSGKTYWGLRDGAWGLQTGTGVIASGNATDAQVLSGVTYSNDSGASTGTMTNNGAGGTITPTTTNQSVAAGYWSSANTVQGDADLVAGNIKSGVNLFGVDGTLYNAAVPKTGQTTSYATGDDGNLKRGVAWPTPRFTDNSDGTVTDNLTGLIWLKNADCFGPRTWAQALTDANGLASGSCGLSDGSSAGDWRLPNVRELQSLVHYGYYDPAVPNTAGTGKWSPSDPFISVQTGYYWSGSTYVNNPTIAWIVVMSVGYVSNNGKTSSYYVWPVRGGQ